MSYRRSIDLALDKKSGILYDADKIFKNQKDGYELRTAYNLGQLDLHCCNCDQELLISDSKKDRLHFKHFPNANYCDLKDSKWTDLEIQQYNDVLRSKESDRHKYLKNRIADLLRMAQGVVPESVIADTKFFFNEREKRRPDVYCRYLDKELVFEIQLSQLSQRYILDRYSFYRGKGIYLIWILDKFDVHGQSQMERDIKYLAPFQNFFKLDEQINSFHLSCIYKSPFITQENTILSPWRSISVSLEQIKFDPEIFQIYYLDFQKTLLETEKMLELKKAKERELEYQQKTQQLNQREELEADNVLAQLKTYRQKGYNFYKFQKNLMS